MALVEQWGVPLAVLGLVLATLFMASIVKQHQIHQARVRLAVRRHERVLLQIESAFADLASVPLSRELRVAMRTEVLVRCRKIQALYRRYPGIRQRTLAAEAAVGSEGSPPNTGVGPIETEQAFRKLLAALDGLLDLLGSEPLLQPLPADVRKVFLRELGERRAEANARFHLVQSSRHEAAGEIPRARAHLTTLLQILRSKGPGTEFVRELYQEAENALEGMNSRQVAMAFGEGVAKEGPGDSAA